MPKQQVSTTFDRSNAEARKRFNQKHQKSARFLTFQQPAFT
jgi:hypothetical protein